MSNEKVPLKDKEKIAQHIISDVLSKAKNPYALFNGDKESLIVLHLIRQMGDGNISLPILHIDTTVYFPEAYHFIDKIQRFWGFQLVRERNEEALRDITIAEDMDVCCRLLKTEALRDAINKYNIDYLFLAKKQAAQSKEPFSIAAVDCNQINPIDYFQDKDMWNYIEEHALSYCSLYDKGFQKIDCAPCTKRSKKVKSVKGENRNVLKKLKELGYI